MYFILKKSGPALPEIRALCETYGCDFVDLDKAVLVNKPFPFHRLAYSKYACRFFDFKEYLGKYQVRGDRRYEIELPKLLRGRVDLERGKIIRVVDRFVGVQEWQFKKTVRQLAYRTHTTLSPDFSKFLLNLARAKEGDFVFDPFCGSGAVLIEAGLLGMKIAGADADYEKVAGCLENLRKFKLRGRIEHVKIQDLTPRKFDAVVTDLPYGLRSKRLGDVENTALRKIPKCLRRGKFAVLVSDRKLSAKNMKLREIHEIRVHKNLARRIHVFQR